MEWVETTGKTVDEAKNRALDQLGVAEDDAEIVVLDEPRAGLFGRVRGEARVRARVRPTTPRPKLDRRDRKKKDGRERGGRSDADTESTDEAPTGAEVPAGRTGGGAKGARRGKGQASEARRTPAAAEGDNPVDGAVAGGETARSTPEAAGDVADGPEAGRDGSSSGGAKRGRRGRRGGSGGAGGSENSAPSDDDRDPFDAAFDDDAEDTPPSRTARAPRAERAKPARSTAGAGTSSSAGSTASDSTADRSDEIMVDAAQVGDEARKFVQGIVDAMGLAGTASVRQDGDDLEVAVDGADLGLLVGPRGTTLQALQELTRVAAQRRLGDHDTRLRVDVGGYRERRKEALSRFAEQIAGQVVAEGTAKRLEPMSSADRKVIHDVLSDFEGVTTRSEGDDPRRCVVIAPAHD